MRIDQKKQGYVNENGMTWTNSEFLISALVHAELKRSLTPY